MKIQVLTNFTKYLTIRNFSKNTIKIYNTDLQVFFRFIIRYFFWNIEIKDINIFLLSNIDTEAIIAFLIYLKDEREISPETVRVYVNSLKCFFKWIWEKYPKTVKGKCNPMSGLNYKNIHTVRLPKYLTLNNAIKLQSIFTEENSKNPLRNNTIITMFLNTGLRLAELVSLNISDIDLENKITKIIGKGNKERIVYLNSRICNQLKKYLESREDECNALFINGKKKRIAHQTVQNICKLAYKLAGLEDYNYTTHTLRHTAATYIYSESKNILVVKNFLGHSSIASTQIYTHLINDELKRAVDSNPLSDFTTEIEKDRDIANERN